MNVVPIGALVKVDSRRYGRFADRTVVKCLRINDLSYLQEVINRFERLWSLRPGTMGYSGCDSATIKAGSVGLYLGSINVDDYLGSNPRLAVYRVILFEKSVYAVKCEDVVLARGHGIKDP